MVCRIRVEVRTPSHSGKPDHSGRDRQECGPARYGHGTLSWSGGGSNTPVRTVTRVWDTPSPRRAPRTRAGRVITTAVPAMKPIRCALVGLLWIGPVNSAPLQGTEVLLLDDATQAGSAIANAATKALSDRT
ncbi:hypothetical protein Lfu02_77710 [Longispora fulva]|nr:hypothetical protein Lfu02_77710 [Longispora fulva]